MTEKQKNDVLYVCSLIETIAPYPAGVLAKLVKLPEHCIHLDDLAAEIGHRAQRIGVYPGCGVLHHDGSSRHASILTDMSLRCWDSRMM